MSSAITLNTSDSNLAEALWTLINRADDKVKDVIATRLQKQRQSRLETERLKAIRAFNSLREDSECRGGDLTLDEINEEIRLARLARKADA